MAEINPDALRQVKAAWDRYEREVTESKLTPQSKRTYLLHSKNFVRWLEGEFTPGGSL